MDIKKYMLSIGQQAKTASFKIASATTIQKNNFLNNLGERILLNEDKIIASNKKLIRFIKWKPKFNNLSKIVKSCIKWEKKQ